MLKHTVSIEWACAQLEISGSSNKKKNNKQTGNRYWRQLAISGSSFRIRLRMREMVLREHINGAKAL